GKVQVLALPPRVLEEGREEDVLAALEGIRADAREPRDARRRGARSLPGVLRFRQGRLVGRGERLQDRDGETRGAARRVHGELGRIAEAPYAVAVLAPC